jgi:cobalt-zinc-cadmium efflux system membrane fusion protein
MYVLAHIEKNDKQVTSVPADAVVSFDNKYYIFAYEKDKEEGGKPFTEYRFIEITKGDTNDGFTEIQLPAGFDIQNTKIVLKGAYKLLAAKKNAGEMTCG